jgi:hypothetical protein
MNKIDHKIFKLIEILKANGTIRFDVQFCKEIGLLRQNLYRIKQGLAHFTPEHISEICINFNVNANWILTNDDQIFNINPSNQKSVQNTLKYIN